MTVSWLAPRLASEKIGWTVSPPKEPNPLTLTMAPLKISETALSHVVYILFNVSIISRVDIFNFEVAILFQTRRN
jgi:hypothetical protein